MGTVDISDLQLGDGDSSNSKPIRTVTAGDYRYMLYTNNKTLVFKGEDKEPSYEITAFGCSCPGDRYNDRPCKHRKQLLSLDDRSAVPPIEGTAVKVKQSNLTLNSSPLLDVDDISGLFG